MRDMKINSRALRQLAEELLDQIGEDEPIPEGERDDLATSLVRQWITYNGCATLFVGEQQVYLVLRQTVLGQPCVFAEPAPHGWMRQLTHDWKVSPDDLPEVIDRLNRGQSAEVVNGDGVPLRLWVNPQEKSRGVEPLAGNDGRSGANGDYCQVAATELRRQLGGGLDPQERDELARSVARQWQQHEGHACLFLGEHQQLVIKLNEHGDGTCDVVTSRVAADLEPTLSSFGFPPAVLAGLIARINRSQEIDFRDRQGVHCRLWYDPKARRICARAVDLVPPAVPSQTLPVLCPKCTAVLKPWQEGERRQTCPHCGQTISLSCPPMAPLQTPPVLCPKCTAVLSPWQEGERRQTCSHCGQAISLG
jgi:ribosomal protein S27E